MAEQINQRRFRQAEERHYAQPKRAPRTRHERQTVNYNAPVVAKARLTEEPKKPVPAKSKTTKLGAKAGLRLAKAKAAKARAAEAEIRPAKAKAVKSQARSKAGGKAKAKPRTLSKTGQRAKKSGKR